MDIKYYDSELGIDGTAEELIRNSWSYSEDYSDEALHFIAEVAKGENRSDWKVPLFVLEDRHNEDYRPYANLKAGKLRGFTISHSETKEYGELEIFEENENVLISIYGVEDEKPFSAAGAYPVEEFMNGEANWLEARIGEILSYNKVIEDNTSFLVIEDSKCGEGECYDSRKQIILSTFDTLKEARFVYRGSRGKHRNRKSK